MYLDQALQEERDVSKSPDEEILALSVNDPSLFSIIVDRYHAPFLRKAQRILGKREEAEDIVQDAFTKIYVNALRFKVQEGATFKSWAYKILIFTAFTRYKKLKRESEFRVSLDPEVYEILPDGAVDLLEQETLRDTVISTLVRMPSTLRGVLEQFYLDDRSQKDIADSEGVAVGVIKTRVLRAKKAFKKLSMAK